VGSRGGGRQASSCSPGSGPHAPRDSATGNTSLRSFLNDVASDTQGLVFPIPAVDTLAKGLTRQGVEEPMDIGMACLGFGQSDMALSEIMGEHVLTDVATLFKEAAKRSKGLLHGWSATHASLAMRSRDSQGAVSIAGGQGASSSLSRAPTPSPAAVHAAKLRLAKNVAKVHRSVAPATAIAFEAAALSLRKDEAQSWDTVLEKCFALLLAFGGDCPRWVELYSSGQEPSTAHLAVQCDTFRMGCDAPTTVDGHRKRLLLLHDWAKAILLSFSSLSPFDVAAFLRDQHTRGKTVPMKMYRGLVWTEKAFGWTLHTKHDVVVSQSRSHEVTSGGNREKPSKMAMVEMVTKMETLVTDAPTVSLRIFAGMMALLADGVLRWKDVQRCEQLHLTKDALVGTTWRMKKKKVVQPWAALRKGFSGKDWADHFIRVLESCGLPGPDFLVVAPQSDFGGFTEKIATHPDALRAMRALLVLSGLDTASALEFTLHSWRHLYPTCAKQLQLADSMQTEIGHWAQGSSMPQRYDSAQRVQQSC
jgi:hypothetical protein